MPRLKRNIFRYPRLGDASDELEAQKTVVTHETPPTAIDHLNGHIHVIDGWGGGSYAVPTPLNALEGVRGHATQAVTFNGWNYGATVPALPADPTRMVVVNWLLVNGSFVTVSTDWKDWVY